ncbi:hypothetical protein ACEOWJ_003289 [Bacillus cereus]|uniref:hypothetical protein n=1 Tax=Bacillus TaxID=1386 RepID=UPI0005583BF1|nr:hypothetical protein [Bacillus sp. UNC322MFChir4.1]
MLKLVDLIDIQKCNIEIDYYVPFSVEIGEQKTYVENKVYWRTGNIQNSLLEIGLGEKTGTLRSITLTAVNQSKLEEMPLQEIKVIEGNPIFDISMINGNIFDYKAEFNVYLGENDITILLGSVDKTKTIVEINRVEMGFNSEEELQFIKIKELVKEEYSELKASLNL